MKREKEDVDYAAAVLSCAVANLVSVGIYICCSKPLTFHNGFMFFLLRVSVSSTCTYTHTLYRCMCVCVCVCVCVFVFVFVVLRAVVVLLLLCCVTLGYRGERQTEPTHSWFLPTFPSG